MKNNSLNYQFKKQLALSIGFLVIVFSFLIYKLFYTGMGSATQRTLMAMAKHYANVAEQSPESPLPKGDLYSVYIGKDSIPENIASKTDIDQLTDYKMRVFDDERIVKIGPPKQVMFILAYPLKKSDEKLFLVYREEGRPFRDRNAFQPPPPRIFAKINIPMSIGLITLLALALFFGLARSLIQKVLNPLKELAVMANSLDENKLAHQNEGASLPVSRYYSHYLISGAGKSWSMSAWLDHHSTNGHETRIRKRSGFHIVLHSS